MRVVDLCLGQACLNATEIFTVEEHENMRTTIVKVTGKKPIVMKRPMIQIGTDLIAFLNSGNDDD